MGKRFKWLLPVAAVVGLVLMAACAGAEPTATPTPTPTKAAVVATPTPTATPRPTATPTPKGPKTGGVLQAAYWEDPKGMDPHATTSSLDRNFVYDFCDPLVNFTPDGMPEPKISLADSWQISQDGLTYTFHLRDVKFQDGTNLDAEAVKTSLERVLDPKLAFAYRAQISSIQKMEVLDPRTIKLTVKAPSAPFILNLAERGGMIMSPKALQEKGDKFRTEPVCAGAFQVVNWQPGSFFETRKHQDYWRKPLPYLDGIRYSVIKDAGVRVAALEAGTADIAWLQSENIPQVEKNKNLGISKFMGYGWRGLRWNRNLPPLDDIRVRKAIVALIDGEAINQSVFFNTFKNAQGGPIPDTLWAYADLSDVQTKYDPKGAADLIKQTGLPTPIKLKMSTQAEGDWPIQAEMMQGMLNASGLFDVTIDVMSSGENQRVSLEERKIPLSPGAIGLRVDPDGMLTISITSQGFYNQSRDVVDADQKRVDELVTQAAQVFDLAKRKELYAEVQRLWVSKLLGSYAYWYRGTYTGYRPYVKGIETIWGADALWRAKELWLDK
ncbi:MAG: hypothetical protein HYY00_04680 [Chloroflexi bacterium]|nr:hypothetical protein [Chloroflexota bacterium]